MTTFFFYSTFLGLFCSISIRHDLQWTGAAKFRPACSRWHPKAGVLLWDHPQ